MSYARGAGSSVAGHRGQTIVLGLRLPAGFSAGLLQGLEKILAVHFIQENTLAPMAPALVNGPRILDPQRTRHGNDLPSNHNKSTAKQIIMTLVRFDSCYLQMAVPTIHQRLLEGCAAQTPAAAALATLVGVASHQREKLEEDPSRPELLLTEPGVGYRVKVEG
jgi:hypothetical protein